jgi:CHASE3 domain sensor protein
MKNILVSIEGKNQQEVEALIKQFQKEIDIIFSYLESMKEKNNEIVEELKDLSSDKVKNLKTISFLLRERLEIFNEWKKKSMLYAYQKELSNDGKKTILAVINAYMETINEDTKAFSVVSFLPLKKVNKYVQ